MCIRDRSNRAKNWQRYDLGEDKDKLSFEEGVDSYIPYAGTCLLYTSCSARTLPASFAE